MRPLLPAARQMAFIRRSFLPYPGHCGHREDTAGDMVQHIMARRHDSDDTAQCHETSDHDDDDDDCHHCLWLILCCESLILC